MRALIRKALAVLVAVTAVLAQLPTASWAETSATASGKALEVTYDNGSVAYADSFDDLADAAYATTIGRLHQDGSYLVPTQVKLLKDLETVVRGYDIYCNLTVDLAGHCLTAPNDSVATALFSARSTTFSSDATYADGTFSGALTLTDSVGGGSVEASRYSFVVQADAGASATVNGGSYRLAQGPSSSAPSFVLANTGGTLTVDGGTFENADTTARNPVTLGPGALLAAGGTTAVEDATLRARGTRSFAITATDGSLTADGSIYACGTYGALYVGEDADVTTEFGTYDGKIDYHPALTPNLTINGGLFSDAAAFEDNVVASGNKTEDGHYLVGVYTQLTPAQFVFSHETGKVADGTPQTITVKPAAGYESALVANTSYEISYENNLAQGVGTCVITAKKTAGGFIGRVTHDFTIGDASDLANAQVGAIPNQVYSAEPIKPDVIVTMGSKTLEENKDYELEFTNNLVVGTAQVTITGLRDYRNKTAATFDIVPKSVAGLTVKPLGDEALREGQICPTPLVYDGEILLEAGVDYTLSYGPNDALGTGTVLITGKGNYDPETTQEAFFTIRSGDDFTQAEVSVGGGKPVPWTGEAVEPEVEVRASGRTLTKDVDYSVTYENNVDAGTGTVVLEGLGGWVGRQEVPFTIQGINITSCEFTFARNPCPLAEGKIPDPGLTVKLVSAATEESDDGTVVLTKSRTLQEGVEYTVSYDVSASRTQAVVSVKGKGEFEGEKRLVLTLEPGYTVVFMDGALNEEIARQIVAAGDAATAPQPPVHEGVVFREWDKAFGKVESDLTVTALYSGADHHTVRFVDGVNNEAIASVLVEHGAGATAPVAPAHDGYAFVGWSRPYSAVSTDLQVTARYLRATSAEAVVPASADNARAVRITTPEGERQTYLTDSAGVYAEGWKFVGGAWYYADKEGRAKTGLQVINGLTYIFDDAGVLQTGWIVSPATGKEVYADPTSGAVALDAWFNDGTGWFLADVAGQPKAGWQYKNGNWYWLVAGEGRDNGRMACGWIWDGSHWYWCELDSGEMRREWLCQDGAWYLLANDGAMRTGWHYYQGAWYYLQPSGIMLTSSWTPDGYWVDANGIWTRSF